MRQIEPKLRLVAYCSLIVLAVMGFVILIAIVDALRLTNSQNNTYLQLNSCIISVQPQVRTPAYVKKCYDISEQRNGNHIVRYGDGK